VVLKKGHGRVHEDVYKEIVKIVRKEIGPVACLYNYSTVDKLPKTRSGKILRRTIRRILDKEPYVVPPTIEDADTLKAFLEIAENVGIKRHPTIKFETVD